MVDSRDAVGLGYSAQQAEVIGDVPTVIAGTGTTQAAAAAITTKSAILNAQSSQTAFYLPTATAATSYCRLRQSLVCIGRLSGPESCTYGGTRERDRTYAIDGLPGRGLRLGAQLRVADAHRRHRPRLDDGRRATG